MAGADCRGKQRAPAARLTAIRDARADEEEPKQAAERDAEADEEESKQVAGRDARTDEEEPKQVTGRRADPAAQPTAIRDAGQAKKNPNK